MSFERFVELNKYIKRDILSYINTAFNTNDEAFNQAREQLLKSSEDSPVFNEPWLEFITRYKSAPNTLLDYLKKSVFCGLDEAKVSLLSPIFAQMLPTPYSHQIESIHQTLIEGKHIVVTTGTGSGKTYCFLLPLLLNIFLESLGAQSRKPWNGGNSVFNPSWWDQEQPKYENPRKPVRTAAVRALLVYPLNALVQDQIEGLRQTLNSTEAEQFYQQGLGGDRIFFGQYNGMTEGKRNPNDKEELTSCIDLSLIHI